MKFTIDEIQTIKECLDATLQQLPEQSLLRVEICKLLDTIEFNGKTYYYENKDKGQVFDNKSKQVGFYKDGKIVFTKDD